MSLNYKKNSLKKPPKSNLRLVIPTVAFCSLSAISAIVLNIPLMFECYKQNVIATQQVDIIFDDFFIIY